MAASLQGVNYFVANNFLVMFVRITFEYESIIFQLIEKQEETISAFSFFIIQHRSLCLKLKKFCWTKLADHQSMSDD